MNDRKAEGANWWWRLQTEGKRDPGPSPYERTTMRRGGERFRRVWPSEVSASNGLGRRKDGRRSYTMQRITTHTQSSHVAVAPPSSNNLKGFGIAAPNDTIIESRSNRYAVDLTKSGGLGSSSTWADKLSKEVTTRSCYEETYLRRWFWQIAFYTLF